MINEILFMNGYGLYVWSAFLFTFFSFSLLYIFIKIQSNKNKFFNKYKKNEILELNIAHNEGNFFTDKKHLNELEDNDLIPIKYCDKEGNINPKTNPNGSLNNIAGIFNKNKNILGMMPHPERMADKTCSNEDGLPLFLSLMN